MTTKMPDKKLEFSESDEAFIKQLASDIGCYYSKANPRTFSLNRIKSTVQGEMGVFAWVHKEGDDYFWVSTRKIWIEAARAKANTGRRKTRPSVLPRDTRQADDSVSFDARYDYDRMVSSLKLICKLR